MAFDNELHAAAPADTPFIEGGAFSPSILAQWLGQSANRHLPLSDREIGVVVLAHGADWHWNQTLRETVRPLERQYRIEYAFSMADQATIERARSEEHTSELQSLMRISYAVFSLKNKKKYK